LEFKIEMNIEIKEKADHSLLVFSITNEQSDTTIVRYWNKLEVKDLLHPGDDKNFILKINHRILNDELNIQAGDQLSVYFWNPQGEAMEYVLSKKKIRVFISKE
jgi:hypothetical protein